MATNDMGFYTGDLELGANAQTSSSCLCLPDTLNNPLSIALEIQSPLVQGTEVVS